MKTYLLLTSLFIFGACVQQTPVPVTETGATKTTSGSGSGSGSGSTGGTGSGTTGSAGGGGTTEALSPAIVRVKNYNQYNQTLEKLTKVNRSVHNGIFNEIIGSLPADNDIGGLTSFNLIAMTRLADAYCKTWVDRESDVGAPLNTKLNPLKAMEVRDYLFSSFLDVDKDEKFASLRVEVDNVLGNDDGVGGDLFPGYASNNTGSNKNLVIAACVTVLASPYITLLE